MFPCTSVLTPVLEERKLMVERMIVALTNVAHESTLNTFDAISGFTFVRSQLRKERDAIEAELAIRDARGLRTPIFPATDGTEVARVLA